MPVTLAKISRRKCEYNPGFTSQLLFHLFIFNNLLFVQIGVRVFKRNVTVRGYHPINEFPPCALFPYVRRTCLKYNFQASGFKIPFRQTTPTITQKWSTTKAMWRINDA